MENEGKAGIHLRAEGIRENLSESAGDVLV
jgi:hypothetical protein